jgi:hypothetical protein
MIPAIGALLPIFGKVLDRIIPDKAAAEKAKQTMEYMYVSGDLKALEADVKLATAQLNVNAQEAKHASLFVAGWRPAIGWVCVIGLFWNFFIQPLVAWFGGWFDVPPPPALDLGDLMTLLLGMLGLGGYRTYEKMSGVARQTMRGQS